MKECVFADRRAAGRALGAQLRRRPPPDPVVLALPRGGVPVALEVAAALDCPLDLLLVRKVGAPGQPEFALAAVVDGTPPQLVLNPETAAFARGDEAYLRAGEAEARAEISRRRQVYLEGRQATSLAGRTALLVDDGIATGTTMLAAVRGVRAGGAARVVVAVPVAPVDAIVALEREADEVVCLATPEPFFAVGHHYADFHQVDDDELVALMRSAGDSEARS